MGEKVSTFVYSWVFFLLKRVTFFFLYIHTLGGKRKNQGTFITVRGVRGLGIRTLTFDTKTSLYAEDRGIQVPIPLEDVKIGGTQFCDQLHCPSNGSINYTVWAV